jgi:tRNA pseudouridine38-40 synthase
VLPRDVAVVDLCEVPEAFHARRSARGKLYRYSLWCDEQRSPLRDRRSWFVPRRLDLAGMQRAASHLRGTHDFSSFQAAGTPTRSSVRSLWRLELEGRLPGELRLWVEGDAFLRGSGALAPDALVAILAARDRRRAGRTAPARGLTLVRVDY